MDRLEKLKQKCNEIWAKYNSSKSQSMKAKLLKEYRGVYEEYKKHREWVRLLEV